MSWSKLSSNLDTYGWMFQLQGEKGQTVEQEYWTETTTSTSSSLSPHPLTTPTFFRERMILPIMINQAMESKRRVKSKKKSWGDTLGVYKNWKVGERLERGTKTCKSDRNQRYWICVLSCIFIGSCSIRVERRRQTERNRLKITRNSRQQQSTTTTIIIVIFSLLHIQPSFDGRHALLFLPSLTSTSFSICFPFREAASIDWLWGGSYKSSVLSVAYTTTDRNYNGNEWRMSSTDQLSWERKISFEGSTQWWAGEEIN